MMEPIEFLAYINNPVSVDAKSLKQVEEVQREYPFCQTAQLLYALNLYAEEHPQYAVQLKRAAAYAADRRQLKHLIDQYRLTHPKPATPKPPATPARSPVLPVTSLPQAKPVVPPPAPRTPRHHVTATPPPQPPPPPPPPSPPSPLPPPHKATPAPSPRVAFTPIIPGPQKPASGEGLRGKLLEIVHRRLQEIAEEHGETPETYDDAVTFTPLVDVSGKRRVTFTVESTGPFSKEELIEKFIREEPRISAPRKVNLKPLQPIVRDLQEEDEIVSETLAILYYKQGNRAKSIRVYEKLCLLFPEKSSYFAARIEEMKAEQQSEY